jgi:hypothetical protein
MNKKEHGGISRRRSRQMQKMTFLHEKSIKNNDSFCKTHNEMMIQQQYIPAWEEKASLVPFVTQGRSWWEVAGGTWRGTQCQATTQQLISGASFGASAPKTAVLQLTHSWKLVELCVASLHTLYHTSAIIMLYTHMRVAGTAQPLCHAEELTR